MCTQDELAKAVGVEQAAISQFLKRSGIDIKPMPISQAIIAYCGYLRESAAGRQGDLAAARSKTEELKQQMLALQIAEKSRQLIPAEEFRQALLPTIKAIRTIFTGLPARIVQHAKTLAGVELEVDFIEEIINDALRSCTEIEVNRIVDTVVQSAGGTEAARADDNDTVGNVLSEDE